MYAVAERSPYPTGRSWTLRGLVHGSSPSRFERIAAGTSQLSHSRSGTLALLLNATLPALSGGSSVLDPLWTEEAMHRAYSLVNLTFALDRRAPLCHNDIVTARMEQALSRNIAACFRSLAISDDKKILPCSDALRIIVRNLVELFGLAAGQISLEMSIERLGLPAFKRRSLVSAASELVINALRHAFDAPSSGHITVGLCRLGLSDAKLSISDDGRGIRPGRYGPSGIAFDLAALLESDLLYSEAERGGTLAEITFPVGR